MKKIKALILLISLSVSANAQKINSCSQIEGDENYYSARSTGSTELEAQENAKTLLVQQFSSLVTSRTSMSIAAENNSSDQQFYNSSKTISNLYLEGLKYCNCNDLSSSKRGDNKDGNASVLAYISKSDINKSGLKVREDINQCLEFYAQKKALGLDGLNELYQAYLHTFFTPLSISCKVDKDSVSNLQLYLENKLKEHLAKVKIQCVEALEHPVYPDDQLRLSLMVKGGTASGLSYNLNCQSINAQKLLSSGVTTFDVLMLPSSPTEEFTCELSLGGISLSDELKAVSEVALITRPISFSVNMQKAIKIDFLVQETGTEVKFSPSVKHLSVRNFEWFINGTKVGSEQTLSVPLNKINSGELTLRLNYNDSLSVTKTTQELNITKVTLGAKLGEEKSEGDIQKSAKSKFDPLQFAQIKDFQTLQVQLENLKKLGKVAVGKKESFLTPDKCWVFLIDPTEKLVKHCLEPGKLQRNDLKTEQVYIDFENKLKGLIAVWVEVY
jgi:hypothetical protein